MLRKIFCLTKVKCLLKATIVIFLYQLSNQENVLCLSGRTNCWRQLRGEGKEGFRNDLSGFVGDL